jgi:hypothetical protein
MQKVLNLRLTGARPLLMRCGRLTDPLDPSAQALARLTGKRPRTPADMEAIARAEWFGGLWLADGRPCLPAPALEACFVQAARTRRLGRIAAAALSCTSHAPLEFEGPQDLEALWDDPNFRLRSGVEVANVRVFRTRPRFARWAATATFELLTNLIDERTVVDLFMIAGAQIGIGDWRPKFGRFLVEVVAAANQGKARRGRGLGGSAGAEASSK